MNLLVNARAAMAGTGTLRIETDNHDVQASVPHRQGQMPSGPYVTLTVRDTRCGMDSTALARIFEPFCTTQEPGKGTGMTSRPYSASCTRAAATSASDTR